MSLHEHKHFKAAYKYIYTEICTNIVFFGSEKPSNIVNTLVVRLT